MAPILPQPQTRQADNQWTVNSGRTQPPLGPPGPAGASPAGGVGRVCQPVCAPRPGPAGWAPESPFAQPGGAQPLAGLQSGRVAGTKPPGPLQALYFLSLPSLNPEVHPHPKQTAEASQGQPGSPEGCPGPAGPPGLAHGINSQGHTRLTLSCPCFLFLPPVPGLGLHHCPTPGG